LALSHSLAQSLLFDVACNGGRDLVELPLELGFFSGVLDGQHCGTGGRCSRLFRFSAAWKH
jgi:hypothetical protein